MELSNERYLSYIDEIPSSEVLGDFCNEFNGWENQDNCYLKMVTNQFTWIDCYEMTIDSMNRIADILDKYGCLLYDSAIDVRFYRSD